MPKPTERTFTADVLAACIGISRRQFNDRHVKWIPASEIVDGRPVKYRPGALRAIVVKLRAEAARKEQRKPPMDEIDDAEAKSPHLERARHARATILEMDLLDRRRRHMLRDALLEIGVVSMAATRACADAVDGAFGRGAGAALRLAADEGDRRLNDWKRRGHAK